MLKSLRRLCSPLFVCLFIVSLSCWSWARPAHVSAFQLSWIIRIHDHDSFFGESHPIDVLRTKAEQEFQAVIAKQALNKSSAVQAYEQRRGRRPPPGFDQWVQYAQRHDAYLIEDFFDRIYDDLNPFWAVPPSDIRQFAGSFLHRISVRNGTMVRRSDSAERPWMVLWGDLIDSIAEFLPDIDMAINVMDEPRVIVPWEVIDRYMTVEAQRRRVVPEADVVEKYDITVHREEGETLDHEYFSSEGQFWDLAVVGCAPDSPARANYTPEHDFTKPIPLTGEFPPHSYRGYVSNWTLTKSPCDNPVFQQLHGSFIEPISLSNSAKLIPLFGGSKLPMNNEILLPAAMYWSDDAQYSGGDFHGNAWDDKVPQMIWRGAATGGRNREDTWTRFQRHRFVAMMNGTTVSAADGGLGTVVGPKFVLPSRQAYGLSTRLLGAWIDDCADAAFGHMVCFPDQTPPGCNYTDPWFHAGYSMPMSEQYAYKYLPDIDGNSFSGRYRGFLLSTSLPVKATIYDEWHDSRLMAWKHFVPMDMTFMDMYGIMEYFMGSKGHEDAGVGSRMVRNGGRDGVARKMALEGKEWAEQVLRKEDMQIYVYRLLLEYARLCDDNRDRLGYVARSTASDSQL